VTDVHRPAAKGLVGGIVGLIVLVGGHWVFLAVTPSEDGDVVEAEVLSPVLVDGERIAMRLATCRDGEVAITETETEVHLAGRGRIGGPADGCGHDPVQLELDPPLGDRSLVDELTGQTLPDVHVRFGRHRG
jgi:hypothetical protein